MQQFLTLYAEILARTAFAFLLLLLIARVLGKPTLSNMTFNDFVSGITLGAIAANLAFNEKLKIGHLTFSLLVFALIAWGMSLAVLKRRSWRKWVSGAPTVLIDKGRIMEDNMRKIRYSLDTLNQCLRQKNVFNIEEVEFAVLEDNGEVSVKRKEEYDFVTRKDLGLAPKEGQTFPVELIMDGRVVEENLRKSGLTTEWLDEELRKRGKTVSEVFYAVRGTRRQLVFDFYRDGVSHPVEGE